MGMGHDHSCATPNLQRTPKASEIHRSFSVREMKPRFSASEPAQKGKIRVPVSGTP